MLKEILRELNESDLLNQVGRILAEQPELFPSTLDNIEVYFNEMGKETAEEIENELATSSLVGADNELAIEQWIDEEEQGIMYRIIDVENDVEIYEIHDGEWLSENGRWSVTRNGVYRNIGEDSELVGDMEDLPDAVQRVYDQLQGE